MARPSVVQMIGVAVVAVGYLIPRLLVSDGVDRFRDDRAKYVVASAAYDAAWLLNDSPVARAFLPAARVTAVENEPGSCPPGEPGSDDRYAQYTARVRFFTFFAIPGPSVMVTCGGWSWMWASVAAR